MEIEKYIKIAKEKGKSDMEIKSALQEVGWQEELINKALQGQSDLLPPPPPPTNSMQRKPYTSNFWDAFEHILMFISLYVVSISIALILHFFVDKWLPGISVESTNNYMDSWKITLLRVYLAALIVSLPLFCFFFLNITKRTLQNPNIRILPTRKILIYLTLVITFIIMLSNIINFVFSFLNGNFSINFVLHLCVTLFVNGVIFAYYLNQVKEDRKKHE